MTYSFKVGDVAIIRDDLEVGMDYGAVSMLEDMYDWRNTVVMITEVLENSSGEATSYRVLQNAYTWSPEMLEALSVSFDANSTCGT